MGQRTRFERARENLREACVKGWLDRYEVRPIPQDGGPLVGDPFTVWFNNGHSWSCSIEVVMALTKGLRIGVAIHDEKPVRPNEHPAACTGLTAEWCPIHGTCTCDRESDLDGLTCPLHSPNSNHATQPEGDTDAES